MSINFRNQVALTLQENNAIAVIDLATSSVIKAFTAGTVDLRGIDTVEDDTVSLTGSLNDVAREPDSIGWIGDHLVATANDGDLFGGSRVWSTFDATTGSVVWDAGNSFHRVRRLTPGWAVQTMTTRNSLRSKRICRASTARGNHGMRGSW